MSDGVIGVVLKGYPRLSETFIAQELLALEQRGLPLALFSLRHPTDRATHPIHAAIRAPVSYLPEYLRDDARRVLRAWRKVRPSAGYARARRIWWRDLLRDPTPNRVRRFGQAMVLAAEAPTNLTHLHAHFLHTPASVTRYAATMLDVPWTCSAHAKDVWTVPDWELREKLRSCAWTTTCTAANARRLRDIAGADADVDLIYHGLDGARFSPPPARTERRDGSDAQCPVRILTVGRAVDKKGFDDLLHALARLPRTLAWELVHVGGGALVADLQRMAHELGIGERVQWRGAQAHDAVLAAYRGADLFVLPCRVSADGDRDGLPNVLVEAQSQRLACVSTTVSGVPELIEHGITGMLVAPRDPPALACAVEALVRDPDLRGRLADAGFARVRSAFLLSAGIDRLHARFTATRRAAAIDGAPVTAPA